MKWLILFVVAVVGVRYLWGRHISKSYAGAIAELQEARGGELKEISYVGRGSFGYDDLEDWKKDLNDIWVCDGFPIGFTYGKRNSTNEARKLYLEKVQQDGTGRIYFYGTDRDKKEGRHFDIQRISSDITLHSYKDMALPEFLEHVCGLLLIEDREAFLQAEEERSRQEWLDSLVTLWKGTAPLEIVFSFPKGESENC